MTKQRGTAAYLLLVVAALLPVVGCGSSSTSSSLRGDARAVGAATGATTITLAKSRHGRVNASVHQSNITATVCKAGWATSVRPAQSVTEPLKRQLYGQEHRTGGLAAWQLDHIVPLELGGAPEATSNLWLEPAVQAAVTDHEENRLHSDLCAGRITLAQARHRIVAWKHLYG